MSAAAGLLARLLAPLRREGVGRRSPWLLLLALCAIVGWQVGLSRAPIHADTPLKITASTGLHDEPRFYFFLHHLGIYPLFSVVPPRTDTAEEAQRLLREQPRALKMDEFVTFRSGDRGRVFLYVPDALLFRRRPEAPSVWPAHAGAWMLALCGVFYGFWRLRRPLLGGMLVALLGSNPFQLHAVYFEENVFSWPITAMLLVLGLNASLLTGRGPSRRWVPFVLACATGVMLALIRTVRSEPAVLLASATLLYLTLSIPWWKRAGIILTLLLAFSLTGRACARYFVSSAARTNALLERVGGVPYTGPVEPYHEVWHPIWCGLGDFDTKYGYVWDDRVAYAYALPILEARAGRPLGLDTGHGPQPQSYDGQGYYPKFFSETPGYHEIIREKVLRDLRGDPRWYATILLKRVGKILTDTTPMQLAYGARREQYTSKWLGPLSLALLVGLIARRRWLPAKLLLFSTPLSLNPFLIYSGGGLTHYSCFHLFAAVLFAYEFVTAMSAWFARRAARSVPSTTAPPPASA